MKLRARAAILLLAALPLLAACGGTWGWHVVDPRDSRGQANLSFMLSGFWATISLSLSTMLLSVTLGLAVAMMGMARLRVLRWTNRAYVELFRAIPILVMILWVFYGLPVVLDIRLDVFVAAMLAIAICDSAFEAEIFRAGIQSVEQGQREAAMALGLSPWQRMRFVILPQAIRRVLPPIANQFIYVVKMSSLASVIGYQELTRKANELVVTVFRPLELYTILILEYLVLILAISFAVRWLEKRMGADQGVRRVG
jgi:polar amino acid transport system permease protein